MKFLILLSLLPLFSLAHAQSSWKELTSAELVLETNGVPKNDPFEIGFHIKLKKGWHTYWKNPGDSGAAPRFSWIETGSGTLSDPIFPVPKRFDESGIMTFGYSDEVLFIFRHSGLSESTRLKVSAEWLVCKEVCLPALGEFELDVPVLELDQIQSSKNRGEFSKAHRKWPNPGEISVELNGLKVLYSVASEEPPLNFDFFPFSGLPFKTLRITEARHSEGRWHWEMALAKEGLATTDLGGVVDLDYKNRRRILQTESVSEWKGSAPLVGSRSKDLVFLLFAFLGGLILNLMPCVFPILSMKLFSVLKTSGHDFAKVRRDNLAYVTGVLITFLGLGLSLSFVRQAGLQVGWGFQLQSPLFVGGLFILFVLLALEMLGFFTFDLLDPSRGQKLTRKEGFLGSFFTGVLAVVVASPCTAPFMGAAVGAGLTRSGFFGALIFFFLGLGLAFPYIVLAISPKWLRWVPKPGAWMNIVKEVMAFPLLFTAVWLLWIFNQVASSQSVLVLGFSLIGLIFSLWIGTYSRKWAWSLAFVFLIGFGGYFQFLEPQPASSKSKIENTLWRAFSPDQLVSRKPGEVIFVNMTADWCITCKVNERLVFDTEEVEQALKDLNITALKGDWTRRDEEITAFLDRFHRAGVPFYVIFSDKNPDGEVLSEVQTPSGFIEKLKSHL